MSHLLGASKTSRQIGNLVDLRRILLMPPLAIAISLPLQYAGTASADTADPVRSGADRPRSQSTTAATIDRLLETAPSTEALADATPEELLYALVRCTELDGDDYCVNYGFVDDASDPTLWTRLEARLYDHFSSTGDMSLLDHLESLAALPTDERTALETADLAEALGDAPIPETSVSADALIVPPPPPASGPFTIKILDSSDARRQVDDDWCGPAAMQMLDGSNDGSFETQAHWATELGTTGEGTWIGAITQKVNGKTTWDDAAGHYKARNVDSWTKDKYWSVISANVSLGAPTLEHPDLNGEYYTYLSTEGNYGGHFQVGRGYQRDSDGIRWIHIFEPFNEPDWTDYTVTTWGPRRAKISATLQANQDNQGTIGVGKKAL